jgi:integrase
MATIRRRSGGYNVQIRKQGYSSITKTFSSITTARKWATSRLFEKGLNPVEVATITGHKDPRMLMRYTHLRAEHLAQKLG